MSARTHLETLLADGKLDETIESYIQLSRQYNDPERVAKGILESGRFNDLLEQQSHGTISQADYQLERARINKTALKLATELPNTWKYPYEPLNEVPAPAAPMPPVRTGLVVGIAACIMLIVGIALKNVLFPQKKEVPTEVPTPTQQQDNKPVPNTGDTPKKSTEEQGARPAQTDRASRNPTPPSTTQPTAQNTPPTGLATPDDKFRSFGKAQISENMEKGYIGSTNRIAYKNLVTKAVFCCYEDGEPFVNGKAKVSENGSDYFFIDKNGNKTQ